jgi:transcriptional/translational regulatory protein YebC/TACO1
VAYLFNKVGLLTYPAGCDEDAVMEAALEGGAEDVQRNSDDSIDVITAADEFMNVKQAMIDAGLTPETAEVIQKADTEVELSLEDAEQTLRLIDMLDDLDDVQEVHSNADFSDEVMAQLQDQ